MAKGQKRSNRERKKPKSTEKKKPAAAPSSFCVSVVTVNATPAVS